MQIFDKRVVLGIGIGIVFASLVFAILKPAELSDGEIEIRANELGMKYPKDSLTEQDGKE